MPLKTSTRLWLGAAAHDEIGTLRKELERLAASSEAANAQLAQSIEAQQCEIEALQRRLQERDEALEGRLGQLHAELDAVLKRIGTLEGRDCASAGDLEVLQRDAEQEKRHLEQLRSGLASLTEQFRWERDDLRNALSGIAKRIERDRRSPQA